MRSSHVDLHRRSLVIDPLDIPEAKCFLQGVLSRGLTWSKYNSDVISDGTYAANTYGYQALKNDVQTRCEKEKFKRQLMRAMRRFYEEEGSSEDLSNEQDGEESEE